MANVVIVGAQWGDEGKGKVVDLYTEFADVVFRYGGGANAGHTLVVDGQKLVTHLIPSGVLRGRGKRCVLGDGMVIDPHTLLEEIAQCQARGLLCRQELLIGLGAHVILPYHKLIDGLREDHGAKQGKAIGTTRRGIGPAYEMKAARRGWPPNCGPAASARCSSSTSRPHPTPSSSDGRNSAASTAWWWPAPGRGGSTNPGR